jgi:tetratricopeptide (TPR) repeat protein
MHMQSCAITLATFLWVLSLQAEVIPHQLSPAEQKGARAEQAIAKNPKEIQPYVDLAMALALRARETSDATYYLRAEEVLNKALDLAPTNFQAQKVQVWILLGKHEFARALEKAEKLNQQTPDDIQLYGFLTDANVELGNYEQAEKDAQWMLDLRPGTPGGLTRGAYLRELMGDIDGAKDLMTEAYQETPAAETEDRAWILTQIAHLELATGKLDSAEKALQAALSFYPGYHYALENLAKVRIAQQRYADAVALLRLRNQNSPQPESIYAMAEALELAGSAEARDAYREFERKARQQMQLADNANRELVFYYVDHAHDPAEGLRIASLEAGRRHDAFTLEAYAWALCANGIHAEARRQMDKVLAFGIRDAKFFYHAGVISAKLGDRTAAVKFLKQSLELNPVGQHSMEVRKILDDFAAANALPSRSDNSASPRK